MFFFILNKHRERNKCIVHLFRILLRTGFIYICLDTIRRFFFFFLEISNNNSFVWWHLWHLMYRLAGLRLSSPLRPFRVHTSIHRFESSRYIPMQVQGFSAAISLLCPSFSFISLFQRPNEFEFVRHEFAFQSSSHSK